MFIFSLKYVDLVVNRVIELLEHLKAKSRKVITITREAHKYKSNEFLMLFPHSEYLVIIHRK